MKLPLQVAFVVDRTISSEDRSVWTLFQNETIHHLMTDLTKRFLATKYAVTAFADFPNDAKRYSNKELDNCFTTIIKFTLDQSEVMKKVNAIKQIPDQFKEYSRGGYYGMMSTAAHLDLGWDGSSDIRKVMVLFTPVYPYTIPEKDGETRKMPTGDGTDICSNSLTPHPTNEFIFESALLQKKILVVLVFLRTNSKDRYLLYDRDFDILYLPYIRFLVPNESSEVTADILQAYDYKALAKSIADGIHEELRICTYNDPPAYNTFGL